MKPKTVAMASATVASDRSPRSAGQRHMPPAGPMLVTAEPNPAYAGVGTFAHSSVSGTFENQQVVRVTVQ